MLRFFFHHYFPFSFHFSFFSFLFLQLYLKFHHFFLFLVLFRLPACWFTDCHGDVIGSGTFRQHRRRRQTGNAATPHQPRSRRTLDIEKIENVRINYNYDYRWEMDCYSESKECVKPIRLICLFANAACIYFTLFKFLVSPASISEYPIQLVRLVVCSFAHSLIHSLTVTTHIN